MEKTYENYLLQILDEYHYDEVFSSNLKLNSYLILLSLNHLKPHTIIHLDEINIIEDFLRKVNNLKVKIQLKRKETEIDELLNNIKEIYQNNTELITKYNKTNIDIITLLDSKEPVNLNNIIDKFTKQKMQKLNELEEDNKLCNDIIYNVTNNDYHIDNNNLYIKDHPIELNKFYDVFSYLLNINNYQTPSELISLVIDAINSNDYSKIVVPLSLIHIVTKTIPNYENIDTSGFNIENIKITELYSFASQNNIKWKNIKIPNTYLYQRIKDIIIKGTYNYKDDKYIFEDKDNDFKVSINNTNIKEFLRQNLTNIIDAK